MERGRPAGRRQLVAEVLRASAWTKSPISLVSAPDQAQDPPAPSPVFTCENQRHDPAFAVKRTP